MRFLLILLLCLPISALAQTRVPLSNAEIGLSFAPIVSQAAPAVVNIYAKRVSERRRTPFMSDPFFDQFFQGLVNPKPKVQNSLGSGVILSSDGIVVSNYHVVGLATDIRVVLNDRREFSARVLLGDKDSDLAILKLEDAVDLPSLRLRNSDDVQVGELVLAIGNPFGVGQTVSSGIVSGLARSGAAGGAGRGYFIQTDAPINPGNSGGALVDMAGNLIGVNTQIVTRSGGSNGIGFAIPANLVAAFVDQANGGRAQFERPWAGMTGQAVNQELADMLGLIAPEGILISALHDDSPFARAGIRVGDVITAVDGAVVNAPSELVYRMSVAGERDVMIDFVRQGDRANVLVSLITAPDTPPRSELALPDQTVLPGLSLARINPAVITEFGLPLSATGVVVTDPGPFGRRVGLRRGDVVRLINGTRVKDPKAVAQALSRPGRFRLNVLRGADNVVLRFRT
ncbi:MAG: trypsin-like peptidase domain-containing protein [Paracoccaceae bacterium]